jgi:tRNA-binding protein
MNTDQREPQVDFAHFAALELRVATVIAVEAFPEARKPAWKLTLDLGEFGVLRSSAQIMHYSADELVGRQVVVVANFPPRQIANFMSECLVLGALDEEKGVVLLSPDVVVANGSRIG